MVIAATKMDTHRTAELLGQTALFRDMDAEELRRIAERVLPRNYSRGQLIFQQGDEAHSLFIVVDGLAKVFLTSESGDEMVLVTLHAGDVLGEVALLDGQSRSAAAEAVEPTRMLELRRRDFLDLLRENPSMTDSLLMGLGATVRRLTDQAADLVFLDLQGRVAKLLVTLAEDRGTQSPGGIELDLELTQGDLAAMVGGSRQSVNQILKAFERRGYIELHGRSVTVRQADALRRRASA